MTDNARGAILGASAMHCVPVICLIRRRTPGPFRWIRRPRLPAMRHSSSSSGASSRA